MTEAKNIALSSAATENMSEVMDRFGLNEISGAARVGFAYALAFGISPDQSLRGSREHNFAVKTVDPEGDFPMLVEIFYSEEELGDRGRYRMVEVLMNEGLAELGDKVESGRVNGIADLLNETQREVASN